MAFQIPNSSFKFLILWGLKMDEIALILISCAMQIFLQTNY